MSQDSIGEAPPKDYAPEDQATSEWLDAPHTPHTIRNALIGAAAAFVGCYLVYQFPWLCLVFAAGVACALGYKKHDSA